MKVSLPSIPSGEKSLSSPQRSELEGGEIVLGTKIDGKNYLHASLAVAKVYLNYTDEEIENFLNKKEGAPLTRFWKD